jgi:hypothetical protein
MRNIDSDINVNKISHGFFIKHLTKNEVRKTNILIRIVKL